MMDDLTLARQLHQDNRAAWQQAAGFYETQIEDDVAFLRGGGKSFLAPELRYLHDLASWCKRAIHLQCHVSQFARRHPSKAAAHLLPANAERMTFSPLLLFRAPVLLSCETGGELAGGPDEALDREPAVREFGAIEPSNLRADDRRRFRRPAGRCHR